MLANYPTFSLDTDIITLPECLYIDIDSIPTFIPNNKLSILVVNIRSCRKNFNVFVSHFFEHLPRFTIIVFVETWLSVDISHLFPINGFKY